MSSENDEIQMTNVEGMTKCQMPNRHRLFILAFVINSSFDIRASTFHGRC